MVLFSATKEWKYHILKCTYEPVLGLWPVFLFISDNCLLQQVALWELSHFCGGTCYKTFGKHCFSPFHQTLGQLWDALLAFQCNSWKDQGSMGCWSQPAAVTPLRHQAVWKCLYIKGYNRWLWLVASFIAGHGQFNWWLMKSQWQFKEGLLFKATSQNSFAK